MVSIFDRAERVIAQFHAENPDLQQQLQQAHKDGWEECKYQALTAMRDIDQSTKDYEETFEKSYDAIASMEYKEAKE